MECLKMIMVEHNDQYHLVPCGKCAFCLTNKRASWMFRIHHEMRNQEWPGYFLTLTYDEKHVKRTQDGRLSLRFKDIQLYIKRLRKRKFYVKYICVGEYGSSTHRPHYHMLLWTNAPQQELQSEWKSSKDGSCMGIVHFGTLTMQSAMYALKYIIQPKQRDVDGIEPTRAQFSKGIGLSYLTTQVYYWHTEDYDNPNHFSYIDGKKLPLPRYYKQKIFTKWQMKNLLYETKCRTKKEKAELLARLKSQGVLEPERYISEIRAEQARRIIQSTKFSEKL